METVTLPPMCGLGGDVFALLYEASSGKLWGVNGSGGAATGATPELYWSKGYRTMPLDGPLAVSVPGEVDAWETIASRFCTRSVKDLVQPAIGYAQEGFPISPKIGGSFSASVGPLSLYPSTGAVLMKNGARIPGRGRAGAEGPCPQPEAGGGGGPRRVLPGRPGPAHGEGPCRRRGPPSRRRTSQTTPPRYTSPPYPPPTGGRPVYQVRPPSQGFVMLEIMNLVEGYDLASLGHNTADTVHLMVEAKKLAFEDRNRHAGDPRFVDWDLERFISKEYAQERRRDIDPSRVSEAAVASPEADGDTSYFCVADGQGNCVSFIHSLSQAFGSRFVAEGTGINFNNRAGRGFSLEAGHANIIAPGKRTIHTLNCYMVFQDGQPIIVGGTPGGDFQVQANPQVVSNMLDHGMDPQAAVDAPRWLSFPSGDPESIHKPFVVQLEPGFSQEARAGLESKGHRTGHLNPASSKVQVIVRDPDSGLLQGASDPRGDGHAAAL